MSCLNNCSSDCNITSGGNNEDCDACLKACKSEINTNNEQNKNIANEYNNVVDTYNLFDSVLDVQSKLTDRKVDVSNNAVGKMDEVANIIMTKSRLIQLAEEEYERSKTGMNNLLWFFVVLFLVAIFVFLHMYNIISSGQLTGWTMTLFVIYICYYLLSRYLDNVKHTIDKIENKTNDVVANISKAIENDKTLADLRAEALKIVGGDCRCQSTSSPSSSPSGMIGNSSKLPSFHNEADLYFDGSAPVQQIYPQIDSNSSNYLIKFDTQVDYGQRSDCNRTVDPMWVPSGLPKMNSGNVENNGSSCVVGKNKSNNSGRDTRCSAPEYTVSSYFGGNETLLS